ncbi:MAG TPA: aromatic ring-hydroxylating dioxygenase subunit alpha [Dongiaceae bacterium]|nr:aromatic ring-hydroxylating dioxygenase subunit alpha [Dongiaceae bacterium]
MNAPIATLENATTALPAEISTAFAAGDFSHMTLPGWTYHNAEFFELEKEYLFLSNWMLVCHVSEVPNPGDFATLRLMGERALVIRGEDGELRAFYNVCRHRASAVVQGRTGSCSSTGIRCPYHGWVYGLDGSLKAVPAEATFPGLNKADYGLKPIDIEVCLGFVFIRFRSVGPSVAERLAPYMPELVKYRLDEMVPFGEPWAADYDVDWKNIIDNYLEGYHVPVGHPGLYRLFGTRYEAEAQEGYVSRAMHWLRDKPSSNWSERHYQKLLPEAAHLPQERRRAWSYYTLLPNLGLDLYPDMIDFFQLIPTGPGKCRIRGRCYRLPGDDRPEMKAAQFLNYRINTQVQSEDDELVRSVQVGLASESYCGGILSEKEVCLRQFHDMVRALLPVARLPEPPEAGTMWTMNETLSKV